MTKKILDKARELAGEAKPGQKAVVSAGEQKENRILVVTGGFHTPALAQRLRNLYWRICLKSWWAPRIRAFT